MAASGSVADELRRFELAAGLKFGGPSGDGKDDQDGGPGGCDGKKLNGERKRKRRRTRLRRALDAELARKRAHFAERICRVYPSLWQEDGVGLFLGVDALRNRRTLAGEIQHTACEIEGRADAGVDSIRDSEKAKATETTEIQTELQTSPACPDGVINVRAPECAVEATAREILGEENVNRRLQLISHEKHLHYIPTWLRSSSTLNRAHGELPPPDLRISSVAARQRKDAALGAGGSQEQKGSEFDGGADAVVIASGQKGVGEQAAAHDSGEQEKSEPLSEAAEQAAAANDLGEQARAGAASGEGEQAATANDLGEQNRAQAAFGEGKQAAAASDSGEQGKAQAASEAAEQTATNDSGEQEKSKPLSEVVEQAAAANDLAEQGNAQAASREGAPPRASGAGISGSKEGGELAASGHQQTHATSSGVGSESALGTVGAGGGIAVVETGETEKQQIGNPRGSPQLLSRLRRPLCRAQIRNGPLAAKTTKPLTLDDLHPTLRQHILANASFMIKPVKRKKRRGEIQSPAIWVSSLTRTPQNYKWCASEPNHLSLFFHAHAAQLQVQYLDYLQRPEGLYDIWYARYTYATYCTRSQ